jgi:hypothetical protein
MPTIDFQTMELTKDFEKARFYWPFIRASAIGSACVNLLRYA